MRARTQEFREKKGEIYSKVACMLWYQLWRIRAQDFFYLPSVKGWDSGWNNYSRTYVHGLLNLQLHQFPAISFLEKKKVGYREPFNRVILFSIRAADDFATFHTCCIFFLKQILIPPPSRVYAREREISVFFEFREIDRRFFSKNIMSSTMAAIDFLSPEQEGGGIGRKFSCAY